MITEIKAENEYFSFCIGKCKYKCPDYVSLAEIRNELIQQQKVK